MTRVKGTLVETINKIADTISSLVYKAYDELPLNGKPVLRSNGVQEWTVVAGVVLEDGQGERRAVAVAAGVKCLPVAKCATANGRLLHDWHAEILALRGLNRFLMEECLGLQKGKDSRYLHVRSGDHQPFAINSDVKVYLVATTAPCGDASLESTASRLDDNEPWEIQQDNKMVLRGRSYFSQLGCVRTKPGRADAPESLSKSCSDKIAHKAVTSFLSSLTAQFIYPRSAYLEAIVIPYSEVHLDAYERAFGRTGRLSSLAAKQWPAGGFQFCPPLLMVSHEPTPAWTTPPKDKIGFAASDKALVYVVNIAKEVLNGPLKIGASFKMPSSKSTSCLSRIRMMETFLKLAEACGTPYTGETYRQIKAINKDLIHTKADVRVVLKTWYENAADDEFTLYDL